jgi:hypothetical protein
MVERNIVMLAEFDIQMDVKRQSEENTFAARFNLTENVRLTKEQFWIETSTFGPEWTPN